MINAGDVLYKTDPFGRVSYVNRVLGDRQQALIALLKNKGYADLQDQLEQTSINRELDAQTTRTNTFDSKSADALNKHRTFIGGLIQNSSQMAQSNPFGAVLVALFAVVAQPISYGAYWYKVNGYYRKYFPMSERDLYNPLARPGITISPSVPQRSQQNTQAPATPTGTPPQLQQQTTLTQPANANVPPAAARQRVTPPTSTAPPTTTTPQGAPPAALPPPAIVITPSQPTPVPVSSVSPAPPIAAKVQSGPTFNGAISAASAAASAGFVGAAALVARHRPAAANVVPPSLSAPSPIVAKAVAAPAPAVALPKPTVPMVDEALGRIVSARPMVGSTKQMNRNIGVLVADLQTQVDEDKAAAIARAKEKETGTGKQTGGDKDRTSAGNVETKLLTKRAPLAGRTPQAPEGVVEKPQNPGTRGKTSGGRSFIQRIYGSPGGTGPAYN